jgi:glycosyltransferase involved in cell wall biosynthesis
VRVLLLNDTSLISGAERCLLDLLAELGDDVEPLVACPRGPLFDAVAQLGVATVALPPVTGSLRLHPLHTPRALAELGLATARVRRLAARRRIDLIHANTLRSGLVAAAARRAGGPPLAAFVHDALAAGAAARVTSSVIGSQAAVLFANSAYSAERFGLAGDDPRRRVVFNPVDLARFDPVRHDAAAARARLDLGPDDLVLAVIAQVTPWKGQREALQTLDALRRTHPRARLLLVGEAKFVARATRYDNPAYLEELRRLVRDRGLEAHVHWLGERADVAAILAAVDVLLVPSWGEPFGRVVVEGMAMGCLVAATSVGGPAEVIEPGVDGLLLEPRQPQQWADAIAATLGRAGAMQAMRRAAPAAAQRFRRDRFAAAVVEGYRAALAAG